MRKFVMEKLLHKKWMTLCLLLGNIFLIGIAVSNPLYYHAALGRTLHTKLSQAQSKDVSQPGEVCLSGRLGKGKKSGLTVNQFGNGAFADPAKVCDAMEDWFAISTLEKSSYYSFPASTISDMTMAQWDAQDKFAVSYLTGLKEHGELVSGEWWSDGVDTSSAIPCMVAQSTMMKRGLMLGQKITLDQVLDDNSKQALTFEIVGVFAEKEGDSYWMEDTSQYSTELFVSEELFEYSMEHVRFEGGNDTKVRFHVLLNEEKISDYNYKKLLQKSRELKEVFSKNAAVTVASGFDAALKEYRSQRGSVRMVMLILQTPVWFLLGVFIYMVSRQLLAMEENEIAMLKSRGAARRQILAIYLAQSLAVCALASLLGIPLGIVLSRLIGSASSFLQFVGGRSMDIAFSWDVAGAFALAFAFSVTVMVVPVISLSRLTIVEQKAGKKRKKKPLWKKLFVDVILLAVCAYVYYNYSQQKELLSVKIASDGNIDYALLLSSSLFIFGCGLLALRLLPAIVWVVYRIGRRFWKPEWYASFLQIIRTSNRQQFISLFLIMTTAFGIFHSVTAGTINQNQKEELQFENGADITLMEEWDSNLPAVRRAREQDKIEQEIVYTEPTYEKYQLLSDQVEAMTRVYRASVTASASQQGFQGTMLAVEPKGFGECCWFRDDLEKKHWYHYLNLLAEQYDGVLISRDTAEKYNVKVGDSIDFSIADELDRYDFLYSYGTVVGIVDYWPTMCNETASLDQKKQLVKNTNYYTILNFDYVMTCTKAQPYSVYIKTKNGDSQPVYDFIEEQGIQLQAFTDTPNEVRKEQNDPLYQCTNGLLTISFLVACVLCTLGFLIYWGLSIRSREMLFGIYRAMGMSRRGVTRMLINEHLFSTFLAILAGVGIGCASSILYVPVMELIYLPGSRYIPMQTVVRTGNLLKLGAVFCAMMAVCILALLRLVAHLKISQALKLGEE